MDSFGDILSELRKDKSINQRDLARILHVPPGMRIGFLIRAVQRLFADRREALCLIPSDMGLWATIGQYNERECR